MSPSVLRSFRPLLETLSALAQGQKAASTAELRPLRAELRKQLLAVKGELTGRVSEREGYLMLFALVVHLDEIVRTSFPEADRATWPLLQQELFDTDRGGELFYQSVGELLESPKLTPAVFQVYYFCLSLGFRGKYAQEPERRTQVMNKLRDWLTASAPVAPPTIDLAAEQPPARVPPLRSRAWPYALAAAAIVGLHLTLSALAASTVASWREPARAPLPLGRQADVRPSAPPSSVADCQEGEPCRSS